MVNVYVEDGSFKVQGTFDLGYMGLYKDDMIEILDSCEEIRYEWDSIYELTQKGEVSDDDIAAYLTERINALEKKIAPNISQLNDTFLWHVYDDMKGCGNRFWEHEELTVPGYDYSVYDGDENFYAPVQMEDDGLTFGQDKPNDGSVKKSSFEAYLRKYKPQLNLDNFIKGITPESMGVTDNYISFQCSDIYNTALICGAYDKIDQTDLRFTDWHNY